MSWLRVFSFLRFKNKVGVVLMVGEVSFQMSLNSSSRICLEGCIKDNRETPKLFRVEMC